MCARCTPIFIKSSAAKNRPTKIVACAPGLGLDGHMYPDFFENATFFYGLAFRNGNGTFRKRSPKWNFSKTPFSCSHVDVDFF